MSAQGLGALRRRLTKLWLISPEKLWLISIALQRRGLWIVAFAVKQLNTILYHNSLAPGASVSPDISLGHYSHGVVVNRNVEIGRRVKIWHNVTLTAGRPARGGEAGSARELSKIVIEDDVKIGTNAVIIAPRGETLSIGRGARVGAGAIVTESVPPGATVVSPPSRVLLKEQPEAGGAEIGFSDRSSATAPES
ncbi:MAG: serine acetyltransferase [Solirubrobacterales bacterium]